MNLGQAQSEWNKAQNEYRESVRSATTRYIAANNGQKPSSQSELREYGYDAVAAQAKLEAVKRNIAQAGFVIYNGKVMDASTSKKDALSVSDSSGAVSASETPQQKAARAISQALKAPTVLQYEVQSKKITADEELRQKKLKEQRRLEELKQKEVQQQNKQVSEKEAAAREKQAQKEKTEKEYYAQRDKERAEYKERLANEAEERKKKKDNDIAEKTKIAAEDAQKAVDSIQKYVGEHTYSDEKKFTGTSKEALDEMRSSAKALWNTAISPLSASLDDAVEGLKCSDAAKEVIDRINQKTLGVNALKESMKKVTGLSDEELKKLSAEQFLELQKDILTNNLTQQAVIDSIAETILKQKDQFANIGKNVENAYLVQKAYINTYLKNTFGNPEFMSKVSSMMSSQISNYIDSLSNEYIVKYTNKIGDKIENTFNRVITTKVEEVTTKISTKLDEWSKIDIVADLNKKLENSFSLKAFEEKLNKNPITKIFAPTIIAIGKVGQQSILKSLQSPKIATAIKFVQDKIKVVQENLKKAKDFIKQKTEMLKKYVEGLKQKAMEAVKSFANKIIADIKSKISTALAGAISGAIGGLSF